MQIVVFEDSAVERLNPIALCRPVQAITVGGARLIDWLAAHCTAGPPQAFVREHLRSAYKAGAWPVAAPIGVHVSKLAPLGHRYLFINAALVPAISIVDSVVAWATTGGEGSIFTGDRVAAAAFHIKPTWWNENAKVGEMSRQIAQTPAAKSSLDLPLLEFPHDVLRYHQQYFAENLAARLTGRLAGRPTYKQQGDGLFVAPDVHLGEHLVCDTSRGPVVIDSGAVLGPFCYLRGPVYIGPGAKINEHAALKDGACVGATTKIGGEVECSIIEAYSNKQHHGFLGHSYLGSWINLGAGTSNSDLKNTYGTVNMQYGDHKVSTGMQFVGCFMGDYVKSAINTGIFTGKTIGVGSMLYGFVTANVPSFINYARSLGQVSEIPADVLARTQSRMFSRRGIEQTARDVQLLQAVFELTRADRANFGEPLPPEPLSL